MDLDNSVTFPARRSLDSDRIPPASRAGRDAAKHAAIRFCWSAYGSGFSGLCTLSAAVHRILAAEARGDRRSPGIADAVIRLSAREPEAGRPGLRVRARSATARTASDGSRVSQQHKHAQHQPASVARHLLVLACCLVAPPAQQALALSPPAFDHFDQHRRLAYHRGDDHGYRWSGQPITGLPPEAFWQRWPARKWANGPSHQRSRNRRCSGAYFRRERKHGRPPLEARAAGER